MSYSIQAAVRENINPIRIRILFRALAIGLGILHTLASIRSQSMNADGVSYLDIGDAYFRWDWVYAINPVWSPLYSWILGFANFIVKPSMEWEFPVVHVINFLIYLGALASFEFMWGKVHLSWSDGENDTLRLPEWLWWAVGYLLFIWTSLSLIQIWSVTPDMLMAGLVFLAAGLIAQIRSGNDDWRLFLSLGLVLGLGYLSKTFMFSMAPVFLVLSWLVQEWSWKALRKTLLAAGVFLLISLPFIILISNKAGKFTIGEAGTVTYVRYVNGIPFPHWQGDPSQGIVPAHPSRIVHQNPPVYEFGEPVGGTYPISMDPSYWYEGIQPRFDFAGLLARVFASALVYMELFFQKQGILFACVLALYVMGERHKRSFTEILKQWALVLPALAAFALYGTVLVEERYIAVFVMLFWVDILSNVRLSHTDNNGSWLRTLAMIACFGLLVNIFLFNLDGFKRLNTPLGTQPVEAAAPPARPLAVAETLKELGIKPGDRVAVIGYAYDSFWARLARVKIIAEMLDADAINLWRGDKLLQESVLQAFAGTGVRAVIAENVPGDMRLDDWHQVGNTSYYVYLIEE